MKQDQIKKPPAEVQAPQDQDEFKAMEVPQVDDIVKKIDDIKKYAPASCCGRLPCKGRTLGCYACAICLDCITGAGCGHDDSRHSVTSGMTQ